MPGELVVRAQHGDEDAFEALVTASADRWYATASLILHDRSRAEDAVQETMIRAWRDLPRLRDPERFDAWARRILVHACVDLARSDRHRRTELPLPTDVASTSDPARVITDRDAVTTAFAELTAEHRAILVLRHYLGHSVPEVADALGIPLGTAKSRLSRAEAAMRAVLETDGETVTEGGTA